MGLFSSHRPDRRPRFFCLFGFLFFCGRRRRSFVLEVTGFSTEIHPSRTKRRILTVIAKTRQQRQEVVRSHTFSLFFLLADDFINHQPER